MQPLFETLAVLFILFLLLRVSLSRRKEGLRLRGGLVALNLLTGALIGLALACALGDALPGGGDIGAAIRRVLPLAGLLLGGLAGHAAFGALWRRYLRLGPASARAWLRRSQFLACLAGATFLIHRLLR